MRGGSATEPHLLDKLEFVLALASEKHFGRAAKVCGVTQPTLSSGLKQLEESLGILIVNRGVRFQDFTPEGELVLEWARRIVGDSRALHEDVLSLRRGLSGQLRVAAIPMAHALVEPLTTLYHEHYPKVQFTLLSRNSQEISQLLENLEIDAGVTYIDDAACARTVSVPLYREHYSLLTAVNGPLGKRRRAITWEEVAQLPLCLLTPDVRMRHTIDGLLREAGRESKQTIESDSIVLLLAHVRTGRWSSILQALLPATLGLTHVLRAIPIAEPAAGHTIGLVAPTRQPMKPLTASLVAQAQWVAHKGFTFFDGRQNGRGSNGVKATRAQY
jgi:DNA-binding transcriptional LysR family regulator